MRIGEIIREVEVLPVREPVAVPAPDKEAAPAPREPVPSGAAAHAH